MAVSSTRIHREGSSDSDCSLKSLLESTLSRNPCRRLAASTLSSIAGLSIQTGTMIRGILKSITYGRLRPDSLVSCFLIV